MARILLFSYEQISHEGKTMRIGAIIQARMSSQRLPGKVLRRALGKPLLLYLYERIIRCPGLDRVIVSTSTMGTDDPIAAFCRQSGIICFRGPLDNVAARFKATMDVFQFDAFVRISGDSPLLDQRLIDRALDAFVHQSCDLVTNVFPRTYPTGQSVEVLHREAYSKGFALMSDANDIEHVTPFFYRHADRFRIINLRTDRDYTGIHLAVDTLSDFNKFESMIRRMDAPPCQYGLEKIVDLYKTLPSPKTETVHG
jgi:spore coat polysaccharide biosynthesis protein SpsF